MSVSAYTIGEVALWLVLAAALGFVLGWLSRELALRAGTTSQATVPAGTASVDAEPSAPPVDEEPVVEPGPYAGSAAPGPGGEPPSAVWVVKAKTRSMILHPPGSPAYARTVADVWFRSEADALAAGFRRPRNA